MMTSKHVCKTAAQQFAKRIFDSTGKDARVFLYRDTETNGLDYIQDIDYYGGYGQSINEQDVYAMVYYGNNGEKNTTPVYEWEYYE